MIDRGQRLDWFDSPEIIVEGAVAAVAFWIFAAHSLTAERPFLDPKLLLDRNFSIGLVIAFFMGMLSYTSLVLFPSLLHDLRDYPDSTIGMLLAARGTGNWIAFCWSCRSRGAFRGSRSAPDCWRRPSRVGRWRSST
jgi:MFS transporter, DHA2 family, multidrug resistance protein